jgi:ABC-type nitrate/sulfonate/bicarbonate transport system substrate-binding protein
MTVRSTRRAVLAAAGTVGTTAIAGCSGSSNGGDGTATEGSTSITMAVSVYPTAAGSARLLMAREQDTFADHDLELDQVVSFGGAGDVVRGISTGGLDVGLGGLAAPVNAYLAGAPINIIGISLGENPIEFFARPDSEIESIRDAAGKRIAVTGQGDSPEAAAIQSIRKADGIAVDDVEFVYVGGLGECLTAVKEGGADLTWIIPPLTFIQLDQGAFKRVWRVRDFAEWIPTQVITAGTTTVQEESDRLQRIVRALNDGADYARNNVEETATVWASAAEYPEPLALKTLQELDLQRLWDVTPDERYFRNTGETMIEQGLVDEQPPWGDIIDQSPLPEEFQVDWLS